MEEWCVVIFPGGGRRAGKGHHCACSYGDGKELPPTIPQVAELTKPSYDFLSPVCIDLLSTITCDPSLWTPSFSLFLLSRLSFPSLLAWSVVSVQCVSSWPHGSQHVHWMPACRWWWHGCWAKQSRELLTSCIRVGLRVRLIWICLLYLHTHFSQRCKNVTPIQISLPSAKCGQNWLASWKFNRVRTDKQHYPIKLISFRIQAKNRWWGFYSAIMCFKTVWNNVINRNGIFRIICSAYENTTAESCCVHVY